MFGWNETAWFAFLVGVALKSTLVLGAAWLLAHLIRRRSAAARHLVWTAAAASVLALPLLSISLPALRFPAAGAILPASGRVVTFQATVIASGSSAIESGAPN